MDINDSIICGASHLRGVSSRKFKRNMLTATMILPISPETTPYDILLLSVLTRGTANYPTNAAFLRRCEELFGTVIDCGHTYVGNSLEINICADFLSGSVIDGEDILGDVVSLMAEVWRSPVLDENRLFDAEKVGLAKDALCDSILASLNDTDGYAAKRCRELMCEGEPSGYSIAIEDVKQITPEALTERYFRLFGMKNWDFFYVGDESFAKVAETIKNAFGDSIGAENPAPLCELLHHADVREDTEKMPVTQSKLYIALDSGVTLSDTDEYYANLMAVEILGISTISKLFMNVRERLSLAYYCSAGYDAAKGIIYISTGISSEDRECAEREIYNQIEDIRHGEIDEEELEAARLSRINTWLQTDDLPYSIWRYCNIRLMLGMTPSIERSIEKIKAVTVDRIRDAASRWKVGAVFFLDADGAEEDECDED